MDQRSTWSANREPSPSQMISILDSSMLSMQSFTSPSKQASLSFSRPIHCLPFTSSITALSCLICMMKQCWSSLMASHVGLRQGYLKTNFSLELKGCPARSPCFPGVSSSKPQYKGVKGCGFLNDFYMVQTCRLACTSSRMKESRKGLRNEQLFLLLLTNSYLRMQGSISLALLTNSSRNQNSFPTSTFTPGRPTGTRIVLSFSHFSTAWVSAGMAWWAITINRCLEWLGREETWLRLLICPMYLLISWCAGWQWLLLTWYTRQLPWLGEMTQPGRDVASILSCRTNNWSTYRRCSYSLASLDFWCSLYRRASRLNAFSKEYKYRQMRQPITIAQFSSLKGDPDEQMATLLLRASPRLLLQVWCSMVSVMRGIRCSMLYSKRMASAGGLAGRGVMQFQMYSKSFRQQLQHSDAELFTASRMFNYRQREQSRMEGQSVSTRQSSSSQATRTKLACLSFSTDSSAIDIDSFRPYTSPTRFFYLKFISVISQANGNDQFKSPPAFSLLSGTIPGYSFTGSTTAFLTTSSFMMRFLWEDQAEQSKVGYMFSFDSEEVRDAASGCLIQGSSSNFLTIVYPHILQYKLESSFSSKVFLVFSSYTARTLSSISVATYTQNSSPLLLFPSSFHLISFPKSTISSYQWQSLLMEQIPPRDMYLSNDVAWVFSFSLASDDRFSPVQTQRVRVRRSLMYLLLFYSSMRRLEYSSTSLLAKEYSNSITPAETRIEPNCLPGPSLAIISPLLLLVGL